MTQQPGMRPSALRGAVDLSSLGRTPPPAPAAAPGGAATPGSIRVDATDAEFEQLMLATREVAAVVVLWSGRHPETERAVTDAVTVAEKMNGALQIVAVDVDTAPGIASAFQAQQIPVTVGVVAAQPVPLYPGVQPIDQMEKIFAELVKVAQENGVTGRLQVGAGDEQPAEEPLSPEHQAAYDAIEQGDFAAAATAYRDALAKNPKDADATAGLAQVSLMERTQGVDLAAARQAAASHPDDIDAALVVADLDLLGGHVEDAFARLIDLVRRTTEDDREKVRTRLVDLFEVVGAQDDRVVKARRALMSALF